MADVIEKVRLHSEIIKGLRLVRQYYIGVDDVGKEMSLRNCEERMVKARNDGELVLEIGFWIRTIARELP